MDNPQRQELHIVPPTPIVNAVVIALGVLSILLVILAISYLKQYSFIGSGVAASNTITVSGEGYEFATPDTATFTVTVQEEAKDVTTAQTTATKKANDIIAYLKQAGIEDKDIQTTDYSISPQYTYQQAVCPVTTNSATPVYCPSGKQTITGYQVSQTLTVKTKDTTKAGELLSGVGSRGASNVSDLSFTIDDQTAIEAQARDKAITDARAKAETLAKSLGVSLVRVVGFSENNGPMPVYYAKAMAVGNAAMDSAAPVPEIPTGQNKITEDVSVTYEIR